MSEEVKTTTAVAEQPPEAPAQPPKKPAKKRRKPHALRNGIIAAVVVAALAVGGFFLWKYLSKEETVDSEIQTSIADWGSIQSTVQGSGSARSKESAVITLQSMGTVEKLFVTEGQMVNEGDPLYEIYSPEAQDKLKTAQKNLDDAQEALNKAHKTLSEDQESYDKVLEDQRLSNEERFIKAPFSGQLLLKDFPQYQVGDKLDSRGGQVALLVDDLKFRIPFYFSYAYADQVRVGQSAHVTVGSTDLTGTLEEINLVRRVTAEGTILFEGVIVVENPGALTDGLTANASLTGANGEPIYPYDTGKLEYYQTKEIRIEPARAHSSNEPTEVLSTVLRDYLDVQEGQTLLTLSAEDFDQDIEDARERVRTSQESIDTAQENVTKAQEELTKAQEDLQNFSATAPISGTITSCTLAEGAEVKRGDTVMTISNNTTMVVTIQVDDRNIAYVKPGMQVNLQSNWGDGGSFVGTVTKIDMSLSGDAMGSGMTNYPVTLEVDNFDGTLLEGMWLSYSFVTSQSDNCIVVPMQSVKYVGDDTSVVFIQADSRPENAVDVDIPETMPGQTPTYPSEADGYYAVPVTTGLSDSYSVEITEGLQGGETIFVNYYVTQAWG